MFYCPYIFYSSKLNLIFRTDLGIVEKLKEKVNWSWFCMKQENRRGTSNDRGILKINFDSKFYEGLRGSTRPLQIATPDVYAATNVLSIDRNTSEVF